MRKINDSYAVFFDTNALKGKYWIDASVRQSVATIGDRSLVTISLYLPEIVQREWSRYYSRYVREQHDKIANAHSALSDMGLENPKADFPDDAKIDGNSKKILANLGFHIVATPHTSIDYPSLVDLAVRHEPPFEPKDGTDKGIKDAVIAHTIRDFAEKNLDHKIVLIGNDGLMVEYLKAIFPAGATLAVYGTIEKFTEALKLEENDLNKELVRGAKEAFFVPDLRSTFYYQLQVRDLLVGKYRSKLIDADKAREHLQGVAYSGSSPLKTDPPVGTWALDTNKILVPEPTFNKKEGGRLFWTTELEFIQKYAVSVMSDDAVAARKYTVNHMAVFSSMWSAKLSVTGQLVDAKIERMEQTRESKSVHPPTATASTALSQLLGATNLADTINAANSSLTSAIEHARMPDIAATLASMSISPAQSALSQLGTTNVATNASSLLSAITNSIPKSK